MFEREDEGVRTGFILKGYMPSLTGTRGTSNVMYTNSPRHDHSTHINTYLLYLAS